MAAKVKPKSRMTALDRAKAEVAALKTRLAETRAILADVGEAREIEGAEAARRLNREREKMAAMAAMTSNKIIEVRGHERAEAALALSRANFSMEMIKDEAQRRIAALEHACRVACTGFSDIYAAARKDCDAGRAVSAFIPEFAVNLVRQMDEIIQPPPASAAPVAEKAAPASPPDMDAGRAVGDDDVRADFERFLALYTVCEKGASIPFRQFRDEYSLWVKNNALRLVSHGRFHRMAGAHFPVIHGLINRYSGVRFKTPDELAEAA